MKKILTILFIVSSTNFAFGSIKDNVIYKLKKIENLSFQFEQNINGKIETGNCVIEYPKKFFAITILQTIKF